MAKIFVGNFSFSVTDEQLHEYFASAGTVVSAKVMKEGQGGRSRGFGFVEYATEEEAQKGIKELNGSVWEGRVVKVSEDRSSRRDEPSESAGGRSSAPSGYFRAQPLDLGIRRRRKTDPFLNDEKLVIDYKDVKLLTKFLSERGRILPRRMTGLTSYSQRKVTKAIKRAQQLGLLAFIRD
ncbi:UNVERIFIED_CONTAM: hypothetical protein GTU68_059850 [Idotea baltica]|nr:hypothetical protein [Idotea baltica]